MSRYKAYSAYRDSGVEWLGEAPSHWSTLPVGRLYQRTKRTNYADKELLSVYRDHGVVPTASRDDNNNKPSEDLTAYQLVEPDNLVMNKMKAWQGSIAISEHEGIVSPAYFVYEPNARMFDLAIPKYIHYLLRHPIYIAQYLRQSKGIRVNQWDLDPDEFKKIELLLPNKEEQKKIIDFLDHETAKIDALIEKQRRLIERLKEKRQAVISHAVTKGLNPNAPMKNSGVEWLGEVPAHWELTQIKFEAELNPKNAVVELTPTLECSFVPMEKLKTDSLLLDEIRFVADVYSGYTLFCDSDVLMAKVTPCFENKNIAVAQGLMNGVGFGSTEIYVLRAGKKINNYFLFYRLQENEFMNIATAAMTGAGGLKRVPTEIVNNFKFALPPLEEQLDICAYLEMKKGKFGALEAYAKNQVELLQERRTALISAAVTGKIDVRDWQLAAA